MITMEEAALPEDLAELDQLEMDVELPPVNSQDDDDTRITIKRKPRKKMKRRAFTGLNFIPMTILNSRKMSLREDRRGNRLGLILARDLGCGSCRGRTSFTAHKRFGLKSHKREVHALALGEAQPHHGVYRHPRQPRTSTSRSLSTPTMTVREVTVSDYIQGEKHFDSEMMKWAQAVKLFQPQVLLNCQLNRITKTVLGLEAIRPSSSSSKSVSPLLFSPSCSSTPAGRKLTVSRIVTDNNEGPEIIDMTEDMEDQDITVLQSTKETIRNPIAKKSIDFNDISQSPDIVELEQITEVQDVKRSTDVGKLDITNVQIIKKDIDIVELEEITEVKDIKKDLDIVELEEIKYVEDIKKNQSIEDLGNVTENTNINDGQGNNRIDEIKITKVLSSIKKKKVQRFSNNKNNYLGKKPLYSKKYGGESSEENPNIVDIKVEESLMKSCQVQKDKDTKMNIIDFEMEESLDETVSENKANTVSSDKKPSKKKNELEEKLANNSETKKYYDDSILLAEEDDLIVVSKDKKVIHENSDRDEVLKIEIQADNRPSEVKTSSRKNPPRKCSKRL